MGLELAWLLRVAAKSFNAGEQKGDLNSHPKGVGLEQVNRCPYPMIPATICA